MIYNQTKYRHVTYEKDELHMKIVTICQGSRHLLSSVYPAKPFKEAEDPVNIIVPLPLSTIPGITFRKLPENSLIVKSMYFWF
jgi:hypothetical protein